MADACPTCGRLVTNDPMPSELVCDGIENHPNGCPYCQRPLWPDGSHEFTWEAEACAERQDRTSLIGEIAALRAKLAAAEKERDEARAGQRQTINEREAEMYECWSDLSHARRAARAWKNLCRQYREPLHNLRPCDWCKRPSGKLTRCGKLEKPTEPVPGGNGFMAWDENLCSECMKVRDAKFAAGEALWLREAKGG